MEISVTIREARPQDAPAIATCLASAFAPYRNQYTAQAFADTVLDAQGVLDRMTHMTIYVAVIAEGEIVGTIACSAESQTGHLRGMAIRTEWQGPNVAQQLLRRAEDDLRAAGCRRVTLDTTAPLQRAIRFYERNGYAPSGTTTEFFRMPLYEFIKHLDKSARS